MATSSLLVGCAIGAAFAGWLTDRFGRKRILIVSALLFAASAIGAAVPRNLGRVRGRPARGRPRDRGGVRPRPALHRGDLAAGDPGAARLAQPDGDRDRNPARLLRELAPLLRRAVLLAVDVRLGRDPLRRLLRGAPLRSGVAALPRGEGPGGGGPRRPREGGGRRAGPPRARRDPRHDRPGGGHAAGALREAAAQAPRDRGLPRRLPAGHRDQHRHLLRLADLQGAGGRAERLGGDRGERDHRERELPDDDRGALDDRPPRPPAADDAGLGRDGGRRSSCSASSSVSSRRPR